MGRMYLLAAALTALPAPHSGAVPARTFAAVVHPSNPAHDMQFRDLLAFFDGISQRWPNGASVVLVERDSASTPYQYLMSRLLNTTAGEYKRRLQNIEYSGGTPVSIKILNSDGAACEFVFNVPPAIAIVETASLVAPACKGIQVLRINGKLPGEEGYRLK
jgi:hypothetical protein